MKRLILITIAICLSLSLAMPAMAVDVDFSGYTWSRFQQNSNLNLQETDQADQYMYMKLRLKTDFKINDNIKLTTQFDALDNRRWGTTDNATVTTKSYTGQPEGTERTYQVDGQNNIDWDVAYATIKTPVGGFLFGRWYGTAWGTNWADSNQDPGDKITWVVPVDKWMFALQYKKIREDDEGAVKHDEDWDKYYAVANYKTENWRTGLLGSFYNLQNFTTPGQINLIKYYAIPAEEWSKVPYADNDGNVDDGTKTIALAAFNTNTFTDYLGAGYAPADAAKATFDDAINLASTMAEADAQIFVLNPYFIGTFGGLTIETEVAWGFGTTKYGEIDLQAIANGLGQPGDYTHYSRPDSDVNGYGGFIDLDYDFGAFSLNGGYAYATGDADPYDNETSAFAYLEESGDFRKLFILTGAEENGGLDQNLGDGAGNLSGGQTKELPNYGYKLWFAGAGFTPTEAWDISFLVGSSEADKVPDGYDKKHGTEYDLEVKWAAMSNLTLRGIVAHLDAGDIYRYVETDAAPITNPAPGVYAGGGKTAPRAEVVDNTTFFLEARVDF